MLGYWEDPESELREHFTEFDTLPSLGSSDHGTRMAPAGVQGQLPGYQEDAVLVTGEMREWLPSYRGDGYSRPLL